MLYCLVLGDAIGKSFLVKVNRNLSVSVLRKTIWEEKKNFFNENKVDADQLKLWMVNIPVDDTDLETKIDAEDIKEQLIKENNLSTFRVVGKYFKEEEVFSDQQPNNHAIRIIIQVIQHDYGLLNFEEYLSYNIPYIAYSLLGTTDKSSTKVAGDPPIDVRLWNNFSGHVNSYTFDPKKKFQRPAFNTNFILTYEEVVRQAFNVNVCMILNKVIQDVQFALRKAGGTGKPDYCCHLKDSDKLLFPIEVKKFNILVTNGQQISDLYNNRNSELALKVRQIIQQLYNYMIENKTKYGVLSTYNDNWFIKREGGILYISKAVNHDSTHLTALKSFAYLAELAKNDTYSSDPKIIEQADNSPYSFQNPRREDHDDSSSDQNPSRESQQSSSEQSSSKSSEQSSNKSKKRKQGRQNMMAQRFNYQDFKYNSILSAGENKKILECEFRGKTIVLKSTDLTKKPKCVDELLNEVEIYKVLAKLQGIYIPELLFYGDLANGMSFIIGMTIVGTTLGHHKISRRLKNRAMATLKKVHKYNILHNDIRKENILIDEKGYVYIIDFGLSIQTDDESLFRLEEAQLDCLLERFTMQNL